MSLRRQFEHAEKILSTLGGEENEELLKICREIRSAEIELHKKSSNLMRRCIERCTGICCRNLQLDLIISHWDFLYILIVRPDLKREMVECLEKEKPFFSADCIFLKDGVGPCIFPSDARPEVCLVTFCDDTGPVKKEIGKVKRKFFKLSWYADLQRIKKIFCRFFERAR